jgi:hypothetical protein
VTPFRCEGRTNPIAENTIEGRQVKGIFSYDNGAHSTLVTPNSTTGGPPVLCATFQRAGGIGIETSTARWMGSNDTGWNIGAGSKEDAAKGGTGSVECRAVNCNRECHERCRDVTSRAGNLVIGNNVAPAIGCAR